MVTIAIVALYSFVLALLSSTTNGMSTSSSSSSKRLKMSSSDVAVTNRQPTIRDVEINDIVSADDAAKMIGERTEAMNQRAKDGSGFSSDELQGVVHSLQNVLPKDPSAVKLDALRDLLRETAHLSHKDWQVTGANSAKLGSILLPKSSIDDASRQMLDRILREGNWDGAASAKRPAAVQPWAVLVTGVNGIRKTTSIYQPWFPDLLREALLTPPGAVADFDTSVLPCGSNTFFRQLDHMMATLCNQDFCMLYSLTRDLIGDSESSDGTVTPSPSVIKSYSDLKAAIFTRYRTISELLGALLLTQAQTLQSNCMLETSGRDVAMFHYVDHFFPKGYSKLALHFTINDLSQAQASVDRRMVHEIQSGIQALKQRDVFEIINANEGGPYGSEVLAGVQADSDRVWEENVLGGTVGKDWFKASIQINAHATEPWTAQAVKPDGTLGTKFAFERK